MKPRRLATIIALVLPAFLYGLYRFSLGVLVPGLESVYSVSDASAGGILSASVGLVGLGVIGSGYLAQRFGDLKTILAGFLLFSIPMGAITISHGLALLLAALPAGLLRERPDDNPFLRGRRRLFPRAKGVRGQLRHLLLQLRRIRRAFVRGLPARVLRLGRPLRSVRRGGAGLLPGLPRRPGHGRPLLVRERAEDVRRAAAQEGDPRARRRRVLRRLWLPCLPLVDPEVPASRASAPLAAAQRRSTRSSASDWGSAGWAPSPAVPSSTG